MPAVAKQQLTLQGNEGPSFDPAFPGMVRTDLAGAAWVEQEQGFLSGHETVFATLRDDTR